MSLRLLWRPVLKLFLGLGLGLALGGMFWACAQGEGERCEREEDCKAGLRCAKSANSISGRCTSGSTTITPDAMEPLPVVPDASVDQPVQVDTAPAPADTAPAADKAPDTASGG
jgi:hypothetical protein